MNLIDFDERFHRYLHAWMHENAARFPKPEQMEEEMPGVYLSFINERADWLGGKSPAEYFDGFDDPNALIEMLKAYDASRLSAPDLLLERLAALGEESVEPLLTLANDASAPSGLRTAALGVLIEIGSERPTEDCLRLIDARGEDDEVADMAAELLAGLGKKPVEAMLSRLEGASPAALTTYLDLLCNFPGDERIYIYTMREFQRRADERAMFASFLGKLGDERAIEPLKKAMAMEDINYLDYLEIANAIEMLGGDAGSRDRDFTGDPYYESLREM